MKRLELLERLEKFELSSGAARLLHNARVAHLATADGSRQPHVIPICFVFDGKNFYSPIDEKPKRAAPTKLKRLSNIAANPHVALLIDRYDEDWRKLAYVLIFAKARLLRSGKLHQRAVTLLRRKYSQYCRMAIDKRPMIVIIPKKTTGWGPFLGQSKIQNRKSKIS